MLWVFHSTCWLVHISGAFRLSTLIWYYWKDLFHLQKLSIDDANFGQKWWRQKKEAKACHACTGVNGLKKNCKTQKQKQQYKFSGKKWQRLHWYIRYWICLTSDDQYIFIFFSVMIWLLYWTLWFKNLIDVRPQIL